jgi:hypothetical protein
MYLATVDCASIPSSGIHHGFAARPKSVGQTHLSDQAPDLEWDLGPTATRARLPAPVQVEARTMPPHGRLWLDNGNGVQHRRKQSIEPHEEQSVGRRKFRFRGRLPAQHVQLIPMESNETEAPVYRLMDASGLTLKP